MIHSILTILCIFLFNVSIYGQWVQTTGAEGNTVTSIVSKGNLLFSSTHGGGVFVSSDDGLTWTESDNGLSIKTVTALTANDSMLFAGNFYGGIFRSSDNGYSWSKLTTPIFSEIRSLLAVGTTIFAGTNGLYRSTNNGNNWTEIKTLSGRYINALYQKGTTLFAGGSGVFRSTDNGSNWSKIQSGIQDTSTFDFTSVGNTIFALANWSISSTSNNGTSWKSVSNPISQGSPLSCLESSGSVLFTGTFNGVYYSTNSGVSWIEANTDLTDKDINTLNIYGAHIFAGTYYGAEVGIWRRSIGDFGLANINEAHMTSQSISISCYPNPAHKITYLSIKKSARDCEVNIYDLLGKKYATLKVLKTNSSPIELPWNTSDVPNGVYHCIVRNGTEYAMSILIVNH